MSVLFQSLINSGKSKLLKKSFRPASTICKCLSIRYYSDVPRKFVTFDEVVEKRRAEAKRSVVVQVFSESSFNELYGYCSKYATINGIHHYKNTTGEHFMLIEFASEENLKDVLQSCSSHQKDFDVMALRSPFLWFRALQGRKAKLVVPEDRSLLTRDGNSKKGEKDLIEDLMSCNNMSEQIQTLYDKTILNDVGVRLRYMVARQLEVVLHSLYANIAVRPFGSSVNGFGRMGCDLDLVLTNVLENEMTEPEKRLVFQEKKCEGGRSPWARHLELVGSLLEMRVPGASRVQRILHARVPIVKYTHDYTDVECDLCYNNLSGVHMSELLWLLCSLDPRVGPLTLAVRRWASAVGLTSPHPGRWITNFPLSLLVLFFLQQKGKNGCVLPSLKFLVKCAGPEDVRISDDNLNCTFLRDLNKLPADSYSQNNASLETLLFEFFEFFSQFDFQDKAISLNEGVAVRKPNALPLYIVNPLEQSLNVSRNVSYEECERIKLEIRNAAWVLESIGEEKTEEWGLLSLLEKKESRSLKKLLRVGNSHRLVSVKDLFKDTDENSPNTNEMKTKLDKLVSDGKRSTVSNGKYKNTGVERAVHRIRREKMT